MSNDKGNNGIFIGLALAAVISAFRRPEPPAPAPAPAVVHTRTVYRDDGSGRAIFFLLLLAAFIALVIWFIVGSPFGINDEPHYPRSSIYGDNVGGYYLSHYHDDRSTNCFTLNSYDAQIACLHLDDVDPVPVEEYEEGRDIDFTTPWKLSERKVLDKGDEWTAATVSCIYLPPEGKRQEFTTESGVHQVPESQTIEDVTKCPDTLDSYFYAGGYYQK